MYRQINDMRMNSIDDAYANGFHKPQSYVYKAKKGLNVSVVKDISRQKHEPGWMYEKRIEGFTHFEKSLLPNWGGDLSRLRFNDIYYYLKPLDHIADTWSKLPKDIKDTYDKIGIPEAEKKFLSGVSAQYESEVVYKSIKTMLTNKGVVFLDMDSALKQFPQMIKKYFGTLIPYHDNKFSALNTGVWSGGSFVYVPKGVRVELPLQAYFRINAVNMGQFERTLIIAEDDSYVHYVEGCTAPIYSEDSLHSAVVEIFVGKRARVRYTTIQNWSTNVYNLVTKRARVDEEGIMEWVDGNLGSKLTMKYPSIYLVGRKSKGDILSIAYAGNHQHQDAGGKVIHIGSETTSQIISKSVSGFGGRTSYRGKIHVSPLADNAKSRVVCDALILDSKSRSDTYPTMQIQNSGAHIEHEASVSKISDEQLFYLRSKGIPSASAQSMIVNGFIEPIVKELPLEYAVEMNRLIQLQMEGSIG